jgi:hypothetical protein
MAARPNLRAFSVKQEEKRESRYEPNPVRWMIVAGLNGITALIGLAFALTIINHPAHQSVPWWIPMIWTMGFGLAAAVALRRMRRDRRRANPTAAPI